VFKISAKENARVSALWRLLESTRVIAKVGFANTGLEESHS